MGRFKLLYYDGMNVGYIRDWSIDEDMCFDDIESAMNAAKMKVWEMGVTTIYVVAGEANMAEPGGK